jgi:hypothetical protein
MPPHPRPAPVALALALALALTPALALAAPPAGATPSADAIEARKSEAREHFDLGLSHFDRGEWAAALAEFLRAREIFPTRSATKNAAICLRKESRFDEALDMFEALEHDYPDLSQTDRTLADDEIASLRRSVGALDVRSSEPGASILVDGRSRGTSPLAGPLRVGVGTHVVRVFKEGFLAFEQRVEIASAQTAALEVRLEALTRTGRLRVTEETGRSLDVVVDGVVVGKAPWEGALAPGQHTVLLRGEGNLGTQPVTTPVPADVMTPLTLVAEELDTSARIDPTPGGALVAVDGVALGRGAWEGKLRSGPHRFEVTTEGFLASLRSVTLRAHERQVFAIALDRDPTSPLWGRRAVPRFLFELDGALVVGPNLGGQVAASCTGSCSATVPVGGMGLLTAAYELPSGLGFGVQGGALGNVETLQDRPAQITGPRLISSDSGTVKDSISLAGLLLGGTVYYHRGDAWPLTLRIGLGVLLATATDDRSGKFTTSAAANPARTAYSATYDASQGATYLYVAPGVRIGRRLGEHLEISAGVDVLLLPALSQPSWTDPAQGVLAGPAGTQGDGVGKFGGQTLTGSLLFVAAPGLGARYEL